jgi:hypothetical protein
MREKIAHELGISMRHLNRLQKRYHDEVAPGIRNRSTRPRQSPNQTDQWLEDLTIKVREKTGLGSFHLAQLINVSMEKQGRPERVTPRTISRILVRQSIIESEIRTKTEWRHFEWGRPNYLIRDDLTMF